MKIACVVNEWPSATETFIRNELRGLQRCGAQIKIFALQRGPGTDPRQFPVYYRDEIPARSSLLRPGRMIASACIGGRMTWTSPIQLIQATRNIPAAAHFARICEREGVQHIHGHFAHTTTDIAIMMARATGLPVSFSAHAWDVYCTGQILWKRLNAAEACITCTNAARKHILAGARPSDRKKVHLIYHGTDLPRFPFIPSSSISLTPSILAVGRLVRKKGFHVLIRACHRLKTNLQFQCNIVGSGPQKEALRTLIADLGLENEVQLVGEIPHEDIPRHYRRADLLVMPSIIVEDGDRDGLPNVVVEAMASGLPVVGSRLSGIPEAVSHERTGLLCKPDNPAVLSQTIHRMIHDKELRQSCVHEARKKVETDFDYRLNSEKIHRLFRHLADGCPPQ
ncbi:MAG: glycosyltransferase family 4 protein [Planctomycetota bacterium]